MDRRVVQERGAIHRAALREFRVAIAFVRCAADVAVEIVIERSAEMKHEIADRIRFVIRTPPELFVRHAVDCGAHLRRQDARDAYTERGEGRGGGVSHRGKDYPTCGRRVHSCKIASLPSGGSQFAALPLQDCGTIED